MSTKSDLTLAVKASGLDKEPQSYSIVASPSERAVLVERFKLVGLSKLEASVTVKNRGGGQGVMVTGDLSASLIQRCIASLADVPEVLNTHFELLLVEPEMANRMDEDESYLDPDAPEYDALEGDVIDLGEIVAQTLSINMEPYPRAPKATADVPKSANITLNEPALEKPNPFSILSGMKDKS